MATPRRDPQDDRTEELAEDIDETRRRAEEHGTLPDDEPRQTFIDPDGDGHIDDDEAGEAFAT